MPKNSPKCTCEVLQIPLAALPLFEGAAATVNGELLKGCTGGTAPAEAAVLCAETAEAVVLEEVALRTDAKGLPAS